MSTATILSHIERYLTAEREYARGRADANAEALARSLEHAQAQLQREYAHTVHPTEPLKILVAIDRADHPAIPAAANLASLFGSPVALIHVINPTLVSRFTAARVNDADPWKVMRDRAVQMLQQARSAIPSNIHSEWILREGDPAAEILATAAHWAAGMIVIGTRNRRAVTQFFLGSTSAAVLRRAPCPVLLIHESPPAALSLPTSATRNAGFERRYPGSLHRHVS